MKYLLLFLFSSTVLGNELSKKHINQNQINDLIASVLILEAGGEKNTNSIPAILEIIQNRANKTDYYSVVRKKYQFSCLNKLSDEQAISIAKKHIKFNFALQLVRENKKSNLLNGANHYFAKGIKNPKWAKKENFVIQIENHYFYKL